MSSTRGTPSSSNNPPEPSRRRSDSGSSSETEFDNALAKVIRESTDDGRSVCRFLINVMDGDLSAFKSHHRISAARELLSSRLRQTRQRSRRRYASLPSPRQFRRTPASVPGPHSSFPRKTGTPYSDTEAGIHWELRPTVRQPSLLSHSLLQKSPRSPSRQPTPTPKRKSAGPRSMR